MLSNRIILSDYIRPMIAFLNYQESCIFAINILKVLLNEFLFKLFKVFLKLQNVEQIAGLKKFDLKMSKTFRLKVNDKMDKVANMLILTSINYTILY